MESLSDDEILEIAKAYALDAVDFAREQFDIALDWSDESIEHVEAMLQALHEDCVQNEPTDEQVFELGKMFGSYVGEVFRQNHGARWCMVTYEDFSMPGLEAERTDGSFWPWVKVHKRIENGPEDNVWHYYQFLRSEDGKGPKLDPMDL